MRYRLIALLLGLAFLIAQAHAQSDSSHVRTDSIGTAGSDSADTVTHAKPLKSPTGALLRSAIIPGWGQLYNGKYIKAAVVAGGQGYCIVQLIRYWSKTDDAYSRFTGESDNGLKLVYYKDYDFYVDRRNLFFWLSGVTMFISMFDAYVDAHLAGFEVDITPSFEESAASTKDLTTGFTLTVHF